MRVPRKLPFWARVKVLLKAQKITQKELAALVDLKYSTLKFWFCYGYYPDVETACDIAHILGVSVEYLTKGNTNSFMKKNAKKALAIKRTAAGIARLAREIEDTCLVKPV